MVMVDAVYWMYLFVVKNYIVCLKRPKINEKEAGVGPFFKESCLEAVCLRPSAI